MPIGIQPYEPDEQEPLRPEPGERRPVFGEDDVTPPPPPEPEYTPPDDGGGTASREDLIKEIVALRREQREQPLSGFIPEPEEEQKPFELDTSTLSFGKPVYVDMENRVLTGKETDVPLYTIGKGSRDARNPSTWNIDKEGSPVVFDATFASQWTNQYPEIKNVSVSKQLDYGDSLYYDTEKRIISNQETVTSVPLYAYYRDIYDNVSESVGGAGKRTAPLMTTVPYHVGADGLPVMNVPITYNQTWETLFAGYEDAKNSQWYRFVMQQSGMASNVNVPASSAEQMEDALEKKYAGGTLWELISHPLKNLPEFFKGQIIPDLFGGTAKKQQAVLENGEVVSLTEKASPIIGRISTPQEFLEAIVGAGRFSGTAFNQRIAAAALGLWSGATTPFRTTYDPQDKDVTGTWAAKMYGVQGSVSSLPSGGLSDAASKSNQGIRDQYYDQFATVHWNLTHRPEWLEKYLEKDQWNGAADLYDHSATLSNQAFRLMTTIESGRLSSEDAKRYYDEAVRLQTESIYARRTAEIEYKKRDPYFSYDWVAMPKNEESYIRGLALFELQNKAPATRQQIEDMKTYFADPDSRFVSQVVLDPLNFLDIVSAGFAVRLVSEAAGKVPAATKLMSGLMNMRVRGLVGKLETLEGANLLHKAETDAKALNQISNLRTQIEETKNLVLRLNNGSDQAEEIYRSLATLSNRTELLPEGSDTSGFLKKIKPFVPPVGSAVSIGDMVVGQAMFAIPKFFLKTMPTTVFKLIPQEVQNRISFAFMNRLFESSTNAIGRRLQSNTYRAMGEIGKDITSIMGESGDEISSFSGKLSVITNFAMEAKKLHETLGKDETPKAVFELIDKYRSKFGLNYSDDVFLYMRGAAINGNDPKRWVKDLQGAYNLSMSKQSLIPLTEKNIRLMDERGEVDQADFSNALRLLKGMISEADLPKSALDLYKNALNMSKQIVETSPLFHLDMAYEFGDLQRKAHMVNEAAWQGAKHITKDSIFATIGKLAPNDAALLRFADAAVGFSNKVFGFWIRAVLGSPRQIVQNTIESYFRMLFYNNRPLENLGWALRRNIPDEVLSMLPAEALMHVSVDESALFSPDMIQSLIKHGAFAAVDMFKAKYLKNFEKLSSKSGLPRSLSAFAQTFKQEHGIRGLLLNMSGMMDNSLRIRLASKFMWDNLQRVKNVDNTLLDRLGKYLREQGIARGEVDDLLVLARQALQASSTSPTRIGNYVDLFTANAGNPNFSIWVPKQAYEMPGALTYQDRNEFLSAALDLMSTSFQEIIKQKGKLETNDVRKFFDLFRKQIKDQLVTSLDEVGRTAILEAFDIKLADWAKAAMQADPIANDMLKKLDEFTGEWNGSAIKESLTDQFPDIADTADPAQARKIIENKLAEGIKLADTTPEEFKSVRDLRGTHAENTPGNLEAKANAEIHGALIDIDQKLARYYNAELNAFDKAHDGILEFFRLGFPGITDEAGVPKGAGQHWERYRGLRDRLYEAETDYKRTLLNSIKNPSVNPPQLDYRGILKSVGIRVEFDDLGVARIEVPNTSMAGGKRVFVLERGKNDRAIKVFQDSINVYSPEDMVRPLSVVLNVDYRKIGLFQEVQQFTGDWNTSTLKGTIADTFGLSISSKEDAIETIQRAMADEVDARLDEFDIARMNYEPPKFSENFSDLRKDLDRIANTTNPALGQRNQQLFILNHFGIPTVVERNRGKLIYKNLDNTILDLVNNFLPSRFKALDVYTLGSDISNEMIFEAAKNWYHVAVRADFSWAKEDFKSNLIKMVREQTKKSNKMFGFSADYANKYAAATADVLQAMVSAAAKYTSKTENDIWGGVLKGFYAVGASNLKNGATSRIGSELGAIINTFNTADASTFIHETFHALKPWLPEEYVKTLDDYALKQGKNTPVEVEELLASTFEEYIRKGAAPQGASEALRNALDVLKNVFIRIYEKVKSVFGSGAIEDDVRKVFDSMLDASHWDDVALRRKTPPTEFGNIRYQDFVHDENRRNNWYFSQAEEVVKMKIPKRVLADDVWKVTEVTNKKGEKITSYAGILGSAGVKAEEMYWTGLDEWLLEHKGQMITRDDILEHLYVNKIDVEEKLLGNITPIYHTKDDFNEEVIYGLRFYYSKYTEDYIRQGEDDRFYLYLNNSLYDSYNSFDVALSRLNFKNTSYILPTRFERMGSMELTEPGGKNYRELLLRLPTAKKFEMSFDEYFRTYFSDQSEGVFREKAIERARDEYAKRKLRDPYDTKSYAWGIFTESHWDEPNVVAHIRFNERVDAEGRRVLFIEEIQSDWHQKGREKGYVNRDDLRKNILESKRFFISKTEELQNLLPLDSELREYSSIDIVGDPLVLDTIADTIGTKEAKDLAVGINTGWKDILRNESLSDRGIPFAPFSKSWEELSMKRMIQWASENGFDRVAWTTGKMQASRYDLGKVVDNIEWDKWKNGTYSIYGNKDGEIIVRKDRISEKELVETIGKDAATKIISDTESAGKLVGEDLIVGGTGMKGFYDEKLPNVSNKLLKKWGVSVGEISLPTPDEIIRRKESSESGFDLIRDAFIKVNGFDITPQMRESVLKYGQPLFQRNQDLIKRASELYPVIEELPELAGWLRYDGKVWDIGEKWHGEGIFPGIRDTDEAALQFAMRTDSIRLRHGGSDRWYVELFKPPTMEQEMFLVQHLSGKEVFFDFSNEARDLLYTSRLDKEDNADLLLQLLERGSNSYYKPSPNRDKWTVNTLYQRYKGEYIEAAAIKVNGKWFEGPSHYDAERKAIDAGELIMKGRQYLDFLGRPPEYYFKTTLGRYLERFSPDIQEFGIMTSGNINKVNDRLRMQDEGTLFQTNKEALDQAEQSGIVEPTNAAISDYKPEKTILGYKLFRTDPRQPGKLFPLFVNANVPTPIGEWVKAESGPITGSGKVKSKLGELAYRPGWHSGSLPTAKHIGGKSNPSQAFPDYRPANQVWAEVEIPADVDWQMEAMNRAQKNKAGEIIARTAHITDQIPFGGHYRYKTNSNMDDEWLISGELKVHRVLTDEEVKKINDAAGVSDLPRVSNRSQDNVNENTLFQDTHPYNESWYYHALDKDIYDNFPEDKQFTAQKVWGWLNNSGQPGRTRITKAEMEFSGIREWLEGQSKDKIISKQDLIDYASQHRVKIREIIQPKEESMEIGKIIRRDELTYFVMPNGNMLSATIYEGRGQFRANVEINGRKIVQSFDAHEDAVKWVQEQSKMMKVKTGTPAWKVFTYPNSDDYKEILIVFDSPSQHYQSAHWNQPDVLAHIRMASRATEQEYEVNESLLGKKLGWQNVLDFGDYPIITPQLLEKIHQQGITEVPLLNLEVIEMQSDWIQEGLRHGFIADIRREISLVSEEIFELEMKQPNLSPDEISHLEELNKQHRELAERLVVAKPDAPFINNWAEVTSKRTLKYAIENGYAGVSWSNGDDIWNMVAVGAEHRWEKVGDKYILRYFEQGSRVGVEQRYNSIEDMLKHREELYAHDGKFWEDRLQKAILANPEGGSFDYMHKPLARFYDETLPRIFDKLSETMGWTNRTQKMDAPFEFFGTNPDRKMGYFEITDDVRQDILGNNLPLWQKRGVRNIPDTVEDKEEVFKTFLESNSIGQFTWGQILKTMLGKYDFANPAELLTDLRSMNMVDYPPSAQGILNSMIEQLQGVWDYLDGTTKMPPIPMSVHSEEFANYIQRNRYLFTNWAGMDNLIGTLERNATNIAQDDPQLVKDYSKKAKTVLKNWGVEAQKEKSDMLSAVLHGGIYNGVLMEDAIGKTNRIMLDYSDYTVIDKNMKLIFPFWMFPTRSLTFWMEQFARHPAMLAFYNKYLTYSRAKAFETGLTTRDGEPLPSTLGYIPIPGTDIWINPLSPLIYRYVLPARSPYADQDVEDSGSMMYKIVNWLIDETSMRGFGLAPQWMMLLNKFREDRPSYGLGYQAVNLLFPPALLPPTIDQQLMAGLRKLDPIMANLFPETINPEVSWQDYMVEREMLRKALEEIERTTDEKRRMEIAKQVTDVLANPDRSAYPRWQDATTMVDNNAYYQRIVSYMTSYYFKSYDPQLVDMLAMRDEIGLLKDSINDAVKRTMFFPEKTSQQLYDEFIRLQYKTDVGKLWSDYMKIGWVTDPNKLNPMTGQPVHLTGEERRNRIAQLVSQEQSSEAYYAAMDNLYQWLNANIQAIPVGAPSAERYKVYQEFAKQRQAIENNPMYYDARKTWAVSIKPQGKIDDYFRDQWWDMITQTRPKWNRETDEDYTHWQARVALWEAELPAIAKAMMPEFQLGLMQYYPELKAGQTLDKLPKSLMLETNADGLKIYEKGRDNIYDAISNAWYDIYAKHWYATYGLRGADSTAAAIQFEEQYKAPNMIDLWSWIEKEYPGKWTREQFNTAMIGKDILNIQESMNYGMPTEDAKLRQMQDDIWYTLKLAGPGKTSEINSYLKAAGVPAYLLDSFYLTSGNISSWPETKREKFYNAVQAYGETKVRALTEGEMNEWARAELINEEYKKQKYAKFEPIVGEGNVDDWVGMYSELSESERKVLKYSGFSGWPGYYEFFLPYFQFKDEFSAQEGHELWTKYYNPDYKPTY